MLQTAWVVEPAGEARGRSPDHAHRAWRRGSRWLATAAAALAMQDGGGCRQSADRRPPATREPGEPTPAAAGVEEGDASQVVVPAPWWLTLAEDGREGVRIARMDVRSFAAPLLSPGDIILAVDGATPNDAEELARGLVAVPPGQATLLTVREPDGTIVYVLLQMPEASAQGDGPGR